MHDVNESGSNDRNKGARRMKNISMVLSLVLIFLLMPIGLIASSNEVQNPQLTNGDEVIEFVLKNRSMYLGKNRDGTIFVKRAIYGINASSEAIRDFLKSVSKLNEGVKRGIIYFDENLIPHAVDRSKSHGINTHLP